MKVIRRCTKSVKWAQSSGQTARLGRTDTHTKQNLYILAMRVVISHITKLTVRRFSVKTSSCRD